MTAILNRDNLCQSAQNAFQIAGWHSKRQGYAAEQLDLLENHGYPTSAASNKILDELGGLKLFHPNDRPRNHAGSIILPQSRISFRGSDIISSMFLETILYEVCYTIGTIICPIAAGHQSIDEVLFVDDEMTFYRFSQSVGGHVGLSKTLEEAININFEQGTRSERRFPVVEADDSFQWPKELLGRYKVKTNT